MAKIVIIGSSVAGHTTAVYLSGAGTQSSLTLVTRESCPAYDRRKLPQLISGAVKEEELFLCDENFYKEKGIEFLKGKEVISVNLSKKIVNFKDKESLSFDFLVVASGASFIEADIPGAKKEGVFLFNGIQEVKDFSSRAILDTVCISGCQDYALEIGRAIKEKYKVEVKLISPDCDTAAQAGENIEIIKGRLQELIGEGQVQAVKLESGKVIAASSVIFMDERQPETDFLRNTPLALENGFVKVDENMRTNIDSVFACGAVCISGSACAGSKNWDEALNESRILTDTLIKAMRGEPCQRSW